MLAPPPAQGGLQGADGGKGTIAVHAARRTGVQCWGHPERQDISRTLLAFLASFIISAVPIIAYCGIFKLEPGTNLCWRAEVCRWSVMVITNGATSGVEPADGGRLPGGT